MNRHGANQKAKNVVMEFGAIPGCTAFRHRTHVPRLPAPHGPYKSISNRAGAADLCLASGPLGRFEGGNSADVKRCCNSVWVEKDIDMVTDRSG